MNTTTAVPWEKLAARYRRYYLYIGPVVSDPLVRGYFSLVASLLLIAFFLIFALSPTINTVLSLQKKITEQRNLLSRLDKKISDLVSAQQNYGQMTNSLPLLNQALPNNPSIQTIISQTSSLASSSGVSVTSTTFKTIPLSSDVIVTTNPKVVSFNFALSGPKAKVIAYLKNVENLPRLIKMTSLSTSADASNDTQSISVTAESYYFLNTTQ